MSPCSYGIPFNFGSYNLPLFYILTSNDLNDLNLFQPSAWNTNPVANINQHDAMAAASELIAGPPISVVCDSVPVDTSLSVAIGTNRESRSKGVSHEPSKRAVHDSDLPETSCHG